MTRTDFYLAHPFDSRHEVRDKLQVPLQDLGVSVANPFYNENLTPRQDVARIEAGFISKFDLEERDSDRVVEADLEAIRNCRMLLAYIPAPGIGTSMEIFYASYVLSIMTFVITDKYAGHPWINKLADTVWPSIEAFIGFWSKGYHQKKLGDY